MSFSGFLFQIISTKNKSETFPLSLTQFDSWYADYVDIGLLFSRVDRTKGTF